MTAWQDQPPISRRQVRQNERNDAVVTSAADAQNASQAANETAKPQEDRGFEGFAREGWDAEARRSTFEAPAPRPPAETPSAATTSADAAPVDAQRSGLVARGEALQGRRAQAGRAVDATRTDSARTDSAGTDSARYDSAGAEPLLYVTQARPSAGSASGYDGPSFRNRVGEPAAEQEADAGEADFRLRDFTPEGRRSSFTATMPPRGSADRETSVPSLNAYVEATGERLDYQTIGIQRPIAAPVDAAAASNDEPRAPLQQAAAQDAVQQAPAQDEVPEAVAAPEATSAPETKQPMTRREMRALEQAGILAPLEVARDVARADIPRLRARIRNTGTDTDEIRTHELEDALAEYDAIAAKTAEAKAAIEADNQNETGNADDGSGLTSTSTPTVFPLIEPGPFGFALPSTAPSPLIASPFAPDGSPEQPFPKISADDLSNAEPLIAAEPVFELPKAVEVARVSEAAQIEQAEQIEQAAQIEQGRPDFDAVLAAEASTARDEQPETYTPPVGHWSTQALIDDDEQFQENTLSRNIGSTSGAITTSSIVMPSVPSVDDILSPLGSTGEILITGSISLPSSMGHTGAVPARYDHSDVDALLAEDDREDYPNTDSAPVRAIRAVSTHTSSGAVITTGMPKGNTKLPLILTIAAIGMAVVIVALAVTAFATGLL